MAPVRNSGWIPRLGFVGPNFPGPGDHVADAAGLDFRESGCPVNVEIRRVAGGAAGGLFATLVMSLVFFAAQRAGAIGTLPPRLIVARFMPRLPPKTSKAVSAVAHLAYGAAAGAVYGSFRSRSLRAGVAFGVAVWATSYEVWVPAAGILPPAHRDSRSRAASILAAHLVFGLVLGRAVPSTRPDPKIKS